jgi:hypothetical protein
MRAQELPAKDCPDQTLETYCETHAVHHPSRTLPVDKISSCLWTQSCKQKFYATQVHKITNKISTQLKYTSYKQNFYATSVHKSYKH